VDLYEVSLEPGLGLSADARRALEQVEHWVNGCIIQWNRISDDRAESDRHLDEGFDSLDQRVRGGWTETANLGMPPSNRGKLAKLFLDIHLFFICVRHVHYWMGELVEFVGDGGLNALWDPMEPRLRAFTDARDFGEHAGSEVKRGGSLGGDLLDETFVYGEDDIEVEVGQETLRAITEMFESVVGLLAGRPLRPPQR